MTSATATFLLSAPDQPGLVARFAGFFFELGLNIIDSSNHATVRQPTVRQPAAKGESLAHGGRFHMRLVVDLGALASPQALARLGDSTSRRALEAAFGELAEGLAAKWSVGYSDVPPKIAILVTRESSCLYDLILRQKQGELPCEIALIISTILPVFSGVSAATFQSSFQSSLSTTVATASQKSSTRM
jgi:formyltetrahydrofolate deformylase